MGQYYHVLYAKKGQSKITNYNMQYAINNRSKTPAEYNGLKIMEHAYIDNGFCKSIAKKLMCTPTRICWLGDYAEDLEFSEFCSAKILPTKEMYSEPSKNIRKENFDIAECRYIINIDRMEYIDIQDYIEKSEYQQKTLFVSKDGTADMKLINQVMFPIALLTARGNGLGSGDYYGCNMNYVGRWAWEIIEIVNALPKGEWKKLDVYFMPNNRGDN